MSWYKSAFEKKKCLWFSGYTQKVFGLIVLYNGGWIKLRATEMHCCRIKEWKQTFCLELLVPRTSPNLNYLLLSLCLPSVCNFWLSDCPCLYLSLSNKVFCAVFIRKCRNCGMEKRIRGLLPKSLLQEKMTHLWLQLTQNSK